MDFVFWIIAIVLIVGIVWWLLNRNNAASTRGSATERHDGGLAGGSAAASAEAAGTAGIPGAAGFGGAAEPVPPATADDEPARSGAGKSFGPPQDVGGGADAGSAPSASQRADSGPETPGDAAAPGTGIPSRAEPAAHHETTAPRPNALQGDAGGAGAAAPRQPNDEWETQWSEASGSATAASPAPAGSPKPADSSASGISAADSADGAAPVSTAGLAQDQDTGRPAAQHTGYVHHPEYTGPHSPTLPGAETAAAESAVADSTTADDAEAAPAAPPAPQDSQQTPEPAGLLAAEQPYGAGSATPGPDGRGPAGFDVKGDAGAMVYYEEGHPDYEQVPGDVWFESAAHAEAAGFRAPRRTRR